MVIAHVVHSLGIGGLENGLVNLVNGSAPGVRHVIVCMTADGRLRTRLRAGVEVITVGKREGHDVRAFATLVRCLRRVGPHIVHSRNWGTFDAVLAARLAGVRAVVHGEHGRDIADPEGRDPRRNRVRRLVSPMVTRFVTVSTDLWRWLVQDVRVPARKVVTICNGVDTVRFVPADRLAARASLGLAPEQPLVGTVGRLDPVKDQAGLVRAFARVRGQNAVPALVIAGEGPCRGDLTDLIATLGLSGHVFLLGERHDVPRVLAALDLFVLPSIAEGISNTVLEAMATGLPVVATRVGGSPELVADGVNGSLVPRADPDALAAAIGRYMGDARLRSLHGEASRRRAVTEFSVGRMCAAYGQLYEGLVSTVNRRAA
jgi:sugar transferase (PEP-CTERM/EpsH1 system associated)